MEIVRCRPLGTFDRELAKLEDVERL